MNRFLFLIAFLISLPGVSKCLIKKNIPYRVKTDKNFNPERNILDIYYPKNSSTPAPVVVFIHGGSWNKGHKDTYRFLGKGFASKGVVTVIINYRLTPEVNYSPMAGDCAAAVKWVYEHISGFGGDSSKIFVAGHSAGGHLAALISNDHSYFTKQQISNPIKGCILIDAFGLDMYTYFPTSTYADDRWFKITFTNEPETWKKASPYYHISRNTIPHLVWIGGKTFPGITTQGSNYYKALTDSSVAVQFEVIKNKKHIGMITQFLRRSNPRYKKIIQFMNSSIPPLRHNEEAGHETD